MIEHHRSLIEKFEKIFIIFIILAFSFSLLTLLAEINSTNEEMVSMPQFSIPAKLNGAQFWLAEAKTTKDRIPGLSGINNLSSNQGFLYVFSVSGNYSIWMKDMLFSVDALWLDENLKVRYIEENLTSESFPKSFTSPGPASYILTLSAGSVRSLDVKAGDRLEFYYE